MKEHLGEPFSHKYLTAKSIVKIKKLLHPFFDLSRKILNELEKRDEKSVVIIFFKKKNHFYFYELVFITTLFLIVADIGPHNIMVIGTGSLSFLGDNHLEVAGSIITIGK